MATKNRVRLSIGRGEKRPASQGAGLTAKGRAKYNRATGSNLKAPVTGKVGRVQKLLAVVNHSVHVHVDGLVNEVRQHVVVGNVNHG